MGRGHRSQKAPDCGSDHNPLAPTAFHGSPGLKDRPRTLHDQSDSLSLLPSSNSKCLSIWPSASRPLPHSITHSLMQKYISRVCTACLALENQQGTDT